MDDAPRILGGRYEVGELIGRGGMAEVHIGHDTRLGRTVAIKILRSDLARDPSFQARFRREAQAAAALNHPAIVAVYDTGEDVFTEPTGSVHHVPFIVMEYVEGHTVRDILRDGSAVPIEEAVEITSGVLAALEYSHHAGIVHRDIKPANVMLTPTGAVKVMDFGIARAMADAAGTMTQTQAVIGTAQYLSPEQARGEAVDTRSDLYSTGCLLFELLTGRPPFIGDSPVAVAYQHAREQAPAPSTVASDVPEMLDRITVKALAKNRDDRYPTAAEFRSDLEAAMRGGRVSAPPVGALGAGAATAVMDAGPASASTQVMGAQSGSTQVMGMPPTSRPPSHAPWESLTGPQPVVPPAGGYDDDEPRKNRTWVWVLSIIGVLALLGIVLVIVLGGDDEDPSASVVTVPNVVGRTEAEARAALEEEGLVPRFELQAHDSEQGLVVSTDPPAGTEVEESREVKVVLSSGPEAVPIPAMQNYTQQQARDALALLGITDVVTDTENHPTIAEDAVIRTEPAAGEQVAPGSRVTLFLSTGLVDLEDLTGQPEADARAKLTELSLIPEVTQEESDEAAGTVIRQTRQAGPVPQRSTVGLVVAIERAPEQVPVPEVFNLREEQAVERLGNSQLNLGNVTREASEDVERGRVIRTDPPAGTPVDEGSSVSLIVSSGPAGGGDGGGGGGNGDD